MIEFDIPPFLIYYFGAALVPLLGRGKVRKIFLVALAVFGLVSVALIQPHTSWVIPTFPGVKQTLLHADRLSMIMGYIFALAGGGAIIYGLSTIKGRRSICVVVRLYGSRRGNGCYGTGTACRRHCYGY